MCCDNKEYKIYPTNWLMKAGIVGFLRITESNGNENFLDNNGTFLKLTEQTINSFFKSYSTFLYNNELYGTIKEFYNNSFLAQVWQKSFLDTLKDVKDTIPVNNNEDNNVNNTENELRKYANYASDKKINNQETLLMNLNKVLRKIKKEEIPHNKFIPIDKIQKINKYLDALNQKSDLIKELAEKKKLSEDDKNEINNFKFALNSKEIGFEEFCKELKDILNDKSSFKVYIKNVIENNFSFSNIAEDNDLICTFCSERKAIKRNNEYVILDEVHFTPLGASPSNLANFFWEGKPNLFMCLPCEIIIYCAAFGFIPFNKKYYFIDAPVNIKELKEINDIWRDWLNANQKESTLKNSFIEILKKSEKMRAKWSIQNISIIEIDPISENTSNIYNLSISPKIAYAIRKRIQSYPASLKEVYDVFLDNLYSKKPLFDLVGSIIYGYLSKEKLKKIDKKKLNKSSTGKLILKGMNLKDIKDLLFFLKFQKEVEDYGK